MESAGSGARVGYFASGGSVDSVASTESAAFAGSVGSGGVAGSAGAVASTALAGAAGAAGAAGSVGAAARVGGVGGGAAGGAPPLRLPGEHFAAALAFLGVGAVGLVRVAPELASGLFPLPRVVAVTHLFTLGWITLSILGALYQFLPVALGAPIRSIRLAHVTFALYLPGLALFVGGLASGASGVVVAGASAVAAGLLLFIVNLGATLHGVRQRDPTWWALAGAAASLLVTVVLGASLAGNLRWGYLGGDRFLALAVHMHVAIAGWVFLVVIGVARRLLPMFLLSHGAGERAGRVALVLTAAGVVALVALHHAGRGVLLGVAGPLLWIGCAAFLFQAAAYFRRRVKPTLDPGLRLAAMGLVFLAVALALAPFAVAHGVAAPRLAVGYGLTLVVGAFSLFVAGHYYKIVPFLVWFHRFGPLVGKRPLPRVGDLYGHGAAAAAGWLLGGGAGVLVLAVLAGAPAAARLGAIGFAAGAAIEIAQLYRVSRRRPT